MSRAGAAGYKSLAMAKNSPRPDKATPEKMVPAIYSLPPSLKARVFDYYHDHRLKSEAEAVRQLLELGLQNAPKAGAGKTAKRK